MEVIRNYVMLYKSFRCYYYCPCTYYLFFQDQTINLNGDDFRNESNEDDDNTKKKKDKKKPANKRKRKPVGGIGNEKAKCWKYLT